MLPGSRTELFQQFLERHTEAQSSRQKMLLLDWLIHAFHVQSGVSSWLVAMNVIQGSRDQLIELCTGLAAAPEVDDTKQAWLEQENDPIREFCRKPPSHAKVLEVAAKLGIRARTKMPENEMFAEILRRMPEMAESES